TRFSRDWSSDVCSSDLFSVSIKRVQRLMREAGIRSIVVKKYRPTPSKEQVVERKNILKRDFSTTTINEKWVGDITYIHTIKDGRSEEHTSELQSRENLV